LNRLHQLLNRHLGRFVLHDVPTSVGQPRAQANTTSRRNGKGCSHLTKPRMRPSRRNA
jgi:hypothetical protein